VRKFRENGRHMLLYIAILFAIVVITLTPLIFTFIRLHILGDEVATAIARIDRVLARERADQAAIAALVAANRTRIQNNATGLAQVDALVAEANRLSEQLAQERASGVLSPAAEARFATLERELAALRARVDASASAARPTPRPAASAPAEPPPTSSSPGHGPPPKRRSRPTSSAAPYERCLVPRVVECSSAR
jgi:hypothetical protein